MRRLPAVALLALASCATFPVVVPGAFVPPPRRLAVVRYTAGPIEGAQLFVRTGVQDVLTPYQAFKQALAQSRRFLVADDPLVASSAAYLSLPLDGYAVSSPAPLRPVRFGSSAAPMLAQSLGADVLLSVHHRLFMVGCGGFTDCVGVRTFVEAWAPNGAPIWEDRFVSDSSPVMSVMGMHDPTQLQHAASDALAHADQAAIGRLIMALGG